MTGKEGEETATRYLEQKGYCILSRNFRYDRGEIDIIAKDRDCLVFVEVKARRTASYGRPEDAVTERKRRQLKKIAVGYLFEHGIDGVACRFDVIALEIHDGQETMRHYENAF